jgi:hypothetical protein
MNISRFVSLRPKLINTKKLCRDCKYFIANTHECGKFGETNIITGNETYYNAGHVRNDNNKCGTDAIYFEQNNMKIITVPYYFLSDYGFIMGIYSCYFSALYLIFTPNK